ncbi:MAG: Stp1/IreP family PP2C-type Ser/Thr phosphatase [Longimicrobiales bacterium]
MKWESAARTDRGRRRPQNEDAFLVRPDLGVFAVADGMGGHAAGDVASRLAVDTIAERIEGAHSRRYGRRRAADILGAAVREANHTIHVAADVEPDKAGMGTTVTALAIVSRDHVAALAHVGDSRAYRFDRDGLRQLTKDHTWVQQQVDEGMLTPYQARRHPFGNVLTRALGTDAGVDVDSLDTELRAGDLLLLCSDGLTTMLSDGDIAAILRDANGLGAAAEALVEEANARGGIDNITVVLVRIEG